MDRRALIGNLLLVIAPLSLSARKANGQQSLRRDGTWWQELLANDRLLFIIGFMDGMQLGRNFSHWGMEKDKESEACSGKAVVSFGKMTEQYFSKVTAAQLTDGLDDFYMDYRNRSLPIHAAVWLVVQGIAGVPKDKLEKSIESWRRNASKSDN